MVWTVVRLAAVIALVAALVPGTSAGASGVPEPLAQAAQRTPCKDSRRMGLSQRRFRRAMQCLHNRARAAHGLKRLRGSRRLNLAAVAHARDMARRNYLGHCSPEGTSPTDRARAKGYRGGAGENIITGSRRARPITLHRRWMDSPAHRHNILGKQYDHLGVGIEREGGMIYGVAMFAFEAPAERVRAPSCS
ncbi:MAG: CAP domain-containing protein [Thermoleophilaceae bacterium]